MSSTAYFAEIRPDRELRRAVLAGSVVVVLLGALAIALMTVPAWIRLPGFVVWVAYGCRELIELRRGWHRCHGVRFAAGGNVEVRRASGEWGRAELADGSVLLRRYGWLRLVAEDGAVIHEPVRGSCRESRDWRRLHVIWRHV